VDLLKSEVRAAEYRARAHDAELKAEASGLALVRQKHELAASVWRAFAANEDQRSANAHRLAASAAANSAAPARTVPREFSSP
jgi:hypothetical protein